MGPDEDCTSGFPPCGDDLGGGSCRFALSGCAQKHAVFSDPNKAFGSSSGNLRRFGASSHLGVLRALSSWIQKTIVVVVIVAVAVTIAVAVGTKNYLLSEVCFTYRSGCISHIVWVAAVLVIIVTKCIKAVALTAKAAIDCSGDPRKPRKAQECR